MKQCSKCSQVKPLTAFSRNARARDGLQGRCKTCCNEIARQHYAANSEQVRETAREYRRANREKVAARNSQYNEANPERVRTWKRRYRNANKDKIAEGNRTYQQAHPEQSRGKQQRYHGRLKAQVFAHYGEQCACCDTTTALSIDHVNGNGKRHRAEILGPGRDAGSTDPLYRWLIANGFPEGFQTLCRPCNTSKGSEPRCRLSHVRDSDGEG